MKKFILFTSAAMMFAAFSFASPNCDKDGKCKGKEKTCCSKGSKGSKDKKSCAKKSDACSKDSKSTAKKEKS